jgi:hypothetical protein
VFNIQEDDWEFEASAFMSCTKHCSKNMDSCEDFLKGYEEDPYAE